MVYNVIHSMTGRWKTRPTAISASNFYWLLPIRTITGVLEWWQPERIPAVLDPENAQEEAVHTKYDTTPDEHGNLLCSWVGHTRHLQGQRDGCEGKNTVCKVKSAIRGSRCSAWGCVNLHIAATIWVSRPNWF